jgi:hypothetical protein
VSSARAQLDLESLGLDRGAHLLVLRALRSLGVGGELALYGTAPDLALQLSVFAREGGHRWRGARPSERETSANHSPSAGGSPFVGTLVAGESLDARLRGAERAGEARDDRSERAVRPHADTRWGVSARGALVEAGAPAWDFSLDDKRVVWADEALKLYAQAAASQWDPETAIPWNSVLDHPRPVEDAVVQVMTYLIENENAALLVPARFLGRIHPHYREVVQLMAVQLADEARHIEVFTRRALLASDALGLSTTGGQRSLQTLFEANDFLLSTVLLSVLGEGSFVDLLWFLHERAPDPITRAIASLTARDESRHVAAGMAHAGFAIEQNPDERARVRLAIEQRHAALQHTSGLNAEVFDALVLIAAGGFTPACVAEGYERVQQLTERMRDGRARRLERLGFSESDARSLAGLHTRNFM